MTALQDPDRVFAAMLSLFDGREPAAAREIAAKLILLLADAVGDDEQVLKAVQAARAPGAKPPDFVHYGYFRSSADFRLRIVLNLKGLDFKRAFVNLRKGEHTAAVYRKINPQAMAPTFRRLTGKAPSPDGRRPPRGKRPLRGESLGQSLAIIEYLDAVHPQPELLPGDEWHKAQIRAFALAVACDIHPIQNLRILRRLQNECGASAETANAWARKTIETGLRPLEVQAAARMRRHRSEYLFGARPTLAEVALIPQIYNARRFNCDLAGCPTLTAVFDNCMRQRPFKQAAPEFQPDCNL